MVAIILSTLMELNWDNQIFGGNLLKAVGVLFTCQSHVFCCLKAHFASSVRHQCILLTVAASKTLSS